MKKDMKTTHKYIALAALALTFAACTQEDDFTPQVDSDAVKIYATIGTMQTRVAYGENGATSFTSGDAFRVVNTMSTSKSEATYTTADGTTWTTTDVFVWNGGTAKNQFQAWYPVAASYDRFTLPVDQSTLEKLAAADWMTASTEDIAKPVDGLLNLGFQHRLAKVTVTITLFTDQFDSDVELASAIIYSLSDETITVESTDKGITPLQTDYSVTAILCPGKYAEAGTFMEITVTDNYGNYEFSVPVNDFLTDTGIEAGKHYSFSLKVGKDAVSINSVSVIDWAEKDIDGGVAKDTTE